MAKLGVVTIRRLTPARRGDAGRGEIRITETSSARKAWDALETVLLRDALKFRKADLAIEVEGVAPYERKLEAAGFTVVKLV